MGKKLGDLTLSELADKDCNNCHINACAICDVLTDGIIDLEEEVV